MAYTWFILLLAIAATSVMLLVAQGTSLGQAIHDRIPDRPRRRLFVASVSFFLTSASSPRRPTKLVASAGRLPERRAGLAMT